MMLKKISKIGVVLVFVSLLNMSDSKAGICSIPGINLVCYAGEAIWDHKVITAELFATFYLGARFLGQSEEIRQLKKQDITSSAYVWKPEEGEWRITRGFKNLYSWWNSRNSETDAHAKKN